MIVGMVVIMRGVIILNVVDGKLFAAYSSVLHISLCVIVSLYVMILMGYMHIIISPLIFISIYMSYNNSRSRFYIKLGLIIMIIWIINFRLPFLRSFFAEVYIIQYNSVILIMIIVIYMVVGYVIMKSVNAEGKRVIYIPTIVLYIIII